jgi:hypothetical protein
MMKTSNSPANRSQPIRAETNRTSAAAGTDRSFTLAIMSRVIAMVLTLVAIVLIGRAGQVNWQVWKAAESRKNLLAHFVDHTKTLTEREIYEAQFWSRYGEHSYKIFSVYLIGGLCAGGVAGWLSCRIRSTGCERRSLDG